MTRKLPPPSRGVAGLALLFCAAFGGAGLAFDLTRADGASWILAQPGGRALLGVAVALALAAFAHGARLVLMRRDGGGRDARHHS